MRARFRCRDCGILAESNVPRTLAGKRVNVECPKGHSRQYFVEVVLGKMYLRVPPSPMRQFFGLKRLETR